MSDTAPPTPPRGDYQKAEGYINKLITLIEQNKLEVIHTDLQKFDPGTIQDHYRLDLNDYQIEISHSKLPNSGADSYVMLFTNLKNVAEGSAEKTILAYTQLSNTQFNNFKTAAETQIEERKRLEEEKRFKNALAPIDSLLDEASRKEAVHHEKSPEPALAEPSNNEPNSWATEAFKQPEPTGEPKSETPEETVFNPPYEENDFIPAPSVNEDRKKDLPESLPKPDSNPYF